MRKRRSHMWKHVHTYAREEKAATLGGNIVTREKTFGYFQLVGINYFSSLERERELLGSYTARRNCN